MPTIINSFLFIHSLKWLFYRKCYPKNEWSILRHLWIHDQRLLLRKDLIFYIGSILITAYYYFLTGWCPNVSYCNELRIASHIFLLFTYIIGLQLVNTVNTNYEPIQFHIMAYVCIVDIINNEFYDQEEWIILFTLTYMPNINYQQLVIV